MMKPKSGSTASPTRTGTSEKSECGRKFDEVFARHSSDERRIEEYIRKNRTSYGNRFV